VAVRSQHTHCSGEPATIHTVTFAPVRWPKPVNAHEYFPEFSSDGKFLVWGITQRGHDHDIADYEIYLWEVGTSPETAARLTFHSGNDRSPDIFIPSALLQKSSRDDKPATDSAARGNKDETATDTAGAAKDDDATDIKAATTSKKKSKKSKKTSSRKTPDKS
jgi:hypothetical protein